VTIPIHKRMGTPHIWQTKIRCRDIIRIATTEIATDIIIRKSDSIIIILPTATDIRMAIFGVPIIIRGILAQRSSDIHGTDTDIFRVHISTEDIIMAVTDMAVGTDTVSHVRPPWERQELIQTQRAETVYPGRLGSPHRCPDQLRPERIQVRQTDDQPEYATDRIMYI